jgi:transposase
MEMAEEIRRVFRETGMSKVAIAQMFGVSDCTIRDVVKYRTWIPDRWKK